MQTNDLRWDDMRVVLALARHGSLKSAARVLEVNISTVSRRLDALEASVGWHLFDRTSEGTRPTAVTEELLPFAEAMEQAASGFLVGLDGLEQEPAGLVRVAAPPGLVDHFIAPALRGLLKHHPKLRVEVLSSIGYTDLTRREADVALRLKRPTSGDLIATRVKAYGYIVLASPKQAKRIGRLRDPGAECWTSWGDNLGHMADSRWLSEQVSRERVVVVSNSMTAQIEAVRHHIALMVAPEPYAKLAGVCSLPLSNALRSSLAAVPQAPLWLVGHRALREVPRIAATWNWLQSSLSALA